MASLTVGMDTDQWVEAPLSSPVVITANTTYVVSYNVPSGKNYQITNNGLANPVTSG